MQTINLQDYTIYIGNIKAAWQAFLAATSYSKFVVLVDENTKAHCLPIFQQYLEGLSFHLIEIPAGEKHKTIDTCQVIWSQMMGSNIDRKSLMIDLGGGVIGDMGGFCASAYKRGIDFVQFPTTLLSQVDASIGGKLGIDFNEVKNSIGVFRNPQAVFIEPLFLKTLSEREVRSGFAEIIKHSLIQSAEQWQMISQIKDLKTTDWTQLLPPSLSVKQKIVTIDPFEKGLRKALNFGHTIGHAVESYFLNTTTPLLHGEAIAIGMICEAYLSYQQIGLAEKQLTAISDFLLSIYDSISIPLNQIDHLLNLMKKDKKNENDQINFSLLPTIGDVKVNQTADGAAITKSLEYYNELLEAKA